MRIRPVPICWEIPFLLDLTRSTFYALFVASAMFASWLRDSHASVACDFPRRTQYVGLLAPHLFVRWLFASIAASKKWVLRAVCLCAFVSCVVPGHGSTPAKGLAG